jgi:hypothetical protein
MEEINIKCEVDDDMLELTINPWDVVSLQEFQCFNCPECDFSCQDESIFHSHAIENHQQVVTFIYRTFYIQNKHNTTEHLHFFTGQTTLVASGIQRTILFEDTT